MEIEEIFRQNGLKITKQRMIIATVLKNAHTPMCAEEIYKTAETLSMSTVYRTLELLCEKNIIKKSCILDSDRMFYELADGKHRHYAVCLDCGRLTNIDVCPVHDASVTDFTITGHKLELYGYCKNCKNKSVN